MTIVFGGVLYLFPMVGEYLQYSGSSYYENLVEDIEIKRKRMTDGEFEHWIIKRFPTSFTASRYKLKHSIKRWFT